MIAHVFRKIKKMDTVKNFATKMSNKDLHICKYL